jgi:hypothetical protein
MSKRDRAPMSKRDLLKVIQADIEDHFRRSREKPLVTRYKRNKLRIEFADEYVHFITIEWPGLVITLGDPESKLIVTWGPHNVLESQHWVKVVKRYDLNHPTSLDRLIRLINRLRSQATE